MVTEIKQKEKKRTTCWQQKSGDQKGFMLQLMSIYILLYYADVKFRQ